MNPDSFWLAAHEGPDRLEALLQEDLHPRPPEDGHIVELRLNGDWERVVAADMFHTRLDPMHRRVEMLQISDDYVGTRCLSFFHFTGF